MPSHIFQTNDQKRSEISFREKLAKQHTEGEMILPDYYQKEKHDEILKARIDATHHRMQQLRNEGIALSPFIELGAERCHRSLVLANDFDAYGFSVDISYHQLSSAEHFAKLFNKNKLPIRVCCDATNLPFKSNSVAFIFCYEFIHHFPKIAPVIEEAYRALSKGHFFFDEEPFKRPRVPLYKQRHKVSSKEYASRSPVRRFLEKYISKELIEEEEHGVLENHQIPLSEWVKALSIFDRREIITSSLEKRLQTRMDYGIGLAHIPHILLGGGIEGLCEKTTAQYKHTSDLLTLLSCPECLLNDQNEEPTLLNKETYLLCPNCKTNFPIVDNIFFLFRRNVLAELYPQFM